MEMSDESYEKGRKKMSMTTLGKEDHKMSMGGSVRSCWKGPAQKPGGIRSQQAPGTSDHGRTDQ